MVNRLKESIVRRMASSHLAGPNVEDAVPICQQAKKRGWFCAIGPFTKTGESPEAIARVYSAALDAICDGVLDNYLSIKVSLLNYDFGIVRELLERGTEKGIRIHFDAMDPDSAVPTFELLERLLKEFKNLGCTLPSRWRRSLEDTERVINYGIPVRIVKGQWVDPVRPYPDPCRNYLAIVNRLSGRAAMVDVATHDRPVAAQALRILRDSATPCEMEQLSSLPQNCARLAKSFQVPFRIYIPFGHPSLPYNIWQVRTRLGIARWVLRDFIVGKHRPLSKGF